MEVEILEATPDPEEVVCKAARNDYMTEWVADTDFADVMAAIDGDTLEEKKENLLIHLMRRAHFGPFEHPHATFAVRGVSRITMAQITRHRHATFDIQSLRYTKPALGVTADPRVRTLPPAAGERRDPGCVYDARQEAAIAAWHRDSVPTAVLAAVLGVGSGDVEAIAAAHDPDPDDENGRDGDAAVGAIDDDRLAGFVAAAGRVDDGVLVVELPARERGFAAALAGSLGAPGQVFSLDGETVRVAAATADLDDGLVAAAETGEADWGEGAALGAFEAAGGFEGERAVVGPEAAALDGLRSWLDGAVAPADRVERGGDTLLTLDAGAVADVLYGAAPDELAALHRGRLLGAMDVSAAVGDRYGEAVADWLDGQQFVYPPSVREEEILSREAGKVAFEAAPWRRIEEIRAAYERQSEHYNRLLAQDVPAEDARAVLGMGITVNITFTMNARALMHLFDMRAAGDAQWEARRLSGRLIELSKEWMPTTFEYYDEEMKDRKNRLGP